MDTSIGAVGHIMAVVKRTSQAGTAHAVTLRSSSYTRHELPEKSGPVGSIRNFPRLTRPNTAGTNRSCPSGSREGDGELGRGEEEEYGRRVREVAQPVQA